MTGSPEMLGGRRQDPAPQDPRRDPGRPLQARAPGRPGGQRHRRHRPRGVEPLPVLLGPLRRADRRRRARPWSAPPPRTTSTSASSPRRPTTRRCSRSCATTGSLSAATRRRLARAAFAHTAAYDAAIVAWLDAGRPDAGLGSGRSHRGRRRGGGALGRPAADPAPDPRAHRGAALRREPAPARLALPHRRHGRAGGTRWSSTGATRCRTSTSSTATPPGGWSTSWPPTPVPGRRPWPSSSTPTRAAPPSPADLVTAYERALECDVQSAFGGVVAIGGDVTTEVAEAVAAGPQADVIIASSYTPGGAGEADEPAQGHAPPLGAGPRAGGPPAAQPRRQRAGAGRRHLRLTPQRVAHGHEAAAHRRRVARPGAGLAGLRPHDLERHRRGRQRTGGRGGRRAAVAGRGRRDRRAEGGRAGQGRRRARATPSSPSPTGCSCWPTPG